MDFITNLYLNSGMVSYSFTVSRVLTGKARIVWRNFYSLLDAWAGLPCVFSFLYLGFHISEWPQDGSIIPFFQVSKGEVVFHGLTSKGA